jgi:hypothetical protein
MAPEAGTSSNSNREEEADCSEICYSAKRALWACSPQSVQENGLVGSLVNRLTAPSTGGYADAATSRTASVAHAARRGAATVISAPANGQHGEQRS